jgi:ABC-type glycerol-3-phosphate transport system permease component
MIRRSRRTGSIAGDLALNAVIFVVLLIVVLPIVHELAKSFSYPTGVDAGRVALLPVKFTLGNYIFYYRQHFESLSRSFLVTVYITVVGTTWSVFVSALTAFPVSRSRAEFRFGPVMMGIVVFSIVFVPPVIPYFLTVRAYGLMDSLWAIILPHTVVAYHLVLLVTFFRQLPQDLFDACYIDGGKEPRMFWSIALPLSKAALATVGIFTAVLLWNIFLHPFLFIRDPNLMPLQLYLRSHFASGAGGETTSRLTFDPFAETESAKSALLTAGMFAGGTTEETAVAAEEPYMFSYAFGA